MAWWAAFSLSLYWGDVLWPPGKRTRREDRALLIVRDEFRPAIPRSGCSPEPASALPADRKLKEEKLVCEVVIWLLLFTVRLSVAAEHYCRRGQIAIAIIPDALAPTGRTGSPLRLCCRHAVQRIVREVLGPIRVQIIGNGYNFAVVVRSVTLREVLHGSVG